MQQSRIIEKAIAVASFIVAAALAFVSLCISEEHDVAANTLLAIAQFLTLTATILGINYKFTQLNNNDNQITLHQVNDQGQQATKADGC